ncbi:protein FAR1-RELATED SEQUENCE 3-like [Silene latifolia]|uniref:protein FAR1-RELATED SEQUENCE 3-like n=1 Tax=Silene latifolia TaxID=37657 RepID=UPI003D775992
MHVSMDGNRGSQVSSGTNHGTRSVFSVKNNENCVNHASIRPGVQRRTFGKDAQNMLDYFKNMQAENPGFFYAIQLDEDNRMANVFWADARSRAAYGHFGDVVTLDSSYRVTQFKVSFAVFTGVNHHSEPILFGCALLLNDSEASFVWLLKTFLTAMGDCPPVSIVTDQDRALKAAVDQIFSKARHCISKWHVLREGRDRLSRVCLTYPNFEGELYNCVNLTETIDDFESSWASITEKYDLCNNDWFQSIYDARRQWVPVYFRDSFFAAVFPNQGVDCSLFEGHVNEHTTLAMLFRQYERVMEYWLDEEIKADFDTFSNRPDLKTPSPMEKQVADLYTRKIFAKFQEELVETFVYTANRIGGDSLTSTYHVAKFEDDHKAYTVILSISDLRASCSCLMFEYSGILCRHILTVFTVTNVLTLPSYYILNRWTKNAKSVGISDELSADCARESLASRYSTLCREAIRYALEGALTSETYYAAVTALREGWKKINLMKKNVSNITPPTSHIGSISADTPLLWPQQDEIGSQFNLNDSAMLLRPVSDMHLVRMASTSLRDEVPSVNMVILPCLKSMTWVMENKNSMPANKVAVINLKLQDYSTSPARESEVKFQLSRVTLEPMLRSMAYISEQLSTPANRVAVINLKLQDTETITGESEVKFQVSRDTLGAMLRSMAYIREQLSDSVDLQAESLPKKQRK